MPTFSIKIDIPALKVGEAEATFIANAGPGPIFESIITQGVESLFQRGLPPQQRDLYAQILAAIDKVDPAVGDITLEDDAMDFVCKIFSPQGAAFHPARTRLITQYIKALTPQA